MEEELFYLESLLRTADGQMSRVFVRDMECQVHFNDAQNLIIVALDIVKGMIKEQ